MRVASLDALDCIRTDILAKDFGKTADLKPLDYICKNYNLNMSLTKNVNYMDDWQDVKEANKKVVDAAAAIAKENHVTQSDVDKKIAEAIASSGPGGGISENKVNEKITKAINQYKSSDKDYYIKSVSVSNGKLVLTYNESKDPVSVNLSSFGFASSADLAGKQDKLTDAQINALADLSNFVTMSALNDYCKKTEVDSKISTEIAKVVANADADFDTLKEIADWIKSDTTGAAKMAADINEIKNQVEDFLTKTQADDLYQAKGEYLTSSALNGYAKSADVDSTYAKKSEIGDFATESDVNTIINGKNFLTENSLEGYAKSADVENAYQPKGDYATNSSLNEYAKSADVENAYQPKGDYLTANSLNDYAKTSEVAEAYQPKGTYLGPEALEGYATNASVSENYQPKGNYLTDSSLDEYAKTADIESTYATKQEIDGLVTETELEEKGYLTQATMNGYAKTEDVANTYATKAQLTGLVTETDVETILTGKNYLTSESLNGYATDSSVAENYQPKGSYLVQSDLNDYAKTADIENAYQPKGSYLTSESLNDYATTESVNTALEDYVPNTSIAEYAKKEELNSYATTESVNNALGNYVTNSSVSENYQPKGTYLGPDALAEYATATIIADTYQTKLSAEQLAVLSTDMSEFVKTVNGQTPDENGNVSIDVPEKVSELTNDNNFTSVEEVNKMLSKLLTRIEVLEKQQTNLAVASTPEEISAISTQDALNTNLVLTSSEAVESMTSSEKTFQSIAVVGGAVDSTVKLNATDSVIVDGIEISGDKDNNNNGKINYKSPELVVKNISITDETTTVYNMFEGSQTPNDASTLNKVVTFSNIYIDDVKLTHNIINVYTPAEGAVITVKDSYFNLDPENSNVMRIANYANSKNITINFENVEWTYENAGKTDFRYAGLLLYQPANTDAMLESPANSEALSTMRINFKNCKYNGELVSSVNLGEHNQVAYIYNAGNAKQIEDINAYKANDDEPIITFSE